MTLDLSRVALLTVVIFGGSVRHSVAQVRSVVIPNTPQCTACRARLVPLVSLGDVEGPGTLAGQPWSVVRTSAHFIAAAGFEPTELKVFDRAGTFVETVGRQGEGPGEYQTVTALVHMPGDTLHVFDRALRRQTVLAPDFTVVRTARLGIAVHAAWPLDPDHVLVNGWSGGAGSPPPPLHVLGIDGTVITSIESVAGGPPPIFYALHPELLVRKAAPGRSGGFWSAALNTYELEGRDRTGAVTQVIRRFPEWIVPWDTTLSVTPAQPPRTAVSDVRDSPDGRLLVLLDVPAADWRAALSDPRSRGDGSQYYEWDPVHAYDTVIEVLDPAAGRLVMTARVAVRLNGFLDAGTVYAYLEDEVGNPSIAVYELVWDQ